MQRPRVSGVLWCGNWPGVIEGPSLWVGGWVGWILQASSPMEGGHMPSQSFTHLRLCFMPEISCHSFPTSTLISL